MQVSTIGVDLAKNVFQAHGVDAAGKVTVTKQLRRGQVMGFFAELPPCLVGMMLGRVTASQMAAASAASFLPRNVVHNARGQNRSRSLETE